MTTICEAFVCARVDLMAPGKALAAASPAVAERKLRRFMTSLLCSGTVGGRVPRGKSRPRVILEIGYWMQFCVKLHLAAAPVSPCRCGGRVVRTPCADGLISDFFVQKAPPNDGKENVMLKRRTV